MKLQTKIPLTPQENQIDYQSKILLMGSCFVENIGGKLEYYKFQNLQNPFGILFHPIAIEKIVARAINKSMFNDEDVYFHNEQWYCFEVHSSVNASEKEQLVTLLNRKLLEFRTYLQSASHIILTFGTAWVYRYLETNSIVANCNKIPQKKFNKELLSIEKITNSIKNTLSLIKEVNPDATFITTVSPIRHLKDGFIENTRSKAHLISSIHQLIDTKKNIHYFPSFEIMMDELRDYRFYSEDMVHPNNTAISIIWEAFSEVWISSNTKEVRKEIEVIQSGLQHKPFHPESKAHQQFLQKLNAKIASLQKRVPSIKF